MLNPGDRLSDRVSRQEKIIHLLLPGLRALDANERNYWLGLLMLLAGLSWGVSIATALTVVGAVLAGESVITSYMAQWIKARSLKPGVYSNAAD